MTPTQVIAVVGGAGSMGRITVTDLCRTSPKNIEIWIADLRADLAQALKNDLTKQLAKTPWKTDRLRVVELSSGDSALKGAHVLINCANYQLNLKIMAWALSVGAHYVDLGGLFYITREQLKLDAEFKAKGLVAILGVGAAPGITNVLARLAAEKLERVTEIHCRVAGMDQTKYSGQPALPVSYSIKTIMEEFSKEPAVFTKGKFKFVKPMSGDLPHRFPKPVGLRRPMYTLHSEVATLPLSFAGKGVQEVSFKIAFDPTFTDRVRFLRDVGLASEKPIRLGSAEVAPIDVVNTVVMSQPQGVQVGKLKQYEVVRTVVKGLARRGSGRAAERETWICDCHTAGKPDWGIGLDIDTGSPPAVAAQMILEGLVLDRGAIAPEVALEPSQFFERLKLRGMHVKISRQSGWGLRT